MVAVPRAARWLARRQSGYRLHRSRINTDCNHAAEGNRECLIVIAYMLPTKNPLIRTRGFFLCTVSHVVASCISITPVSDVVSPLATCDSSLLASQRFRLRPTVAVDVFALSAMARTVVPVPSSGQMILSI